MSTDTQNLTNGDNANNGNLLLVDIEDELRRSYLGYAVSTLVSRALPDVRDGFKPVARRILYAMRELGLSPTSRHVKCAAVVGETMKRFHPHGDQAIYDTLVRMAQPFSLRYPLVDGQGNFGCFTGDTRIKLLDGTEKSFAELAERPADEVFHVYSVDKQGRIVVGEGRNARITRRKARLVEVTLDNGKKIRCTPDHRFMLRDGAYKEAQHLTGEDSLMPGYFDTAPVKERLNDYLRILQPAALVSAGQNNNHRAVSVRWLGDCEDVYDITVDEHHNFLLASGVFVHNSVDGDPAAAMRYCVAGDTYIVTGAGLRRIDSLSDGAEDIQTKVLSIGGKVNTASKWFDCGEHPTRRLRTRRGYEVTGTLNHPLLVCSPDGSKCPRLVWKLVSQIQPGDYLVLDRSEALWPEQPVDLRPYHPEIPAGSRTQRHELPDHLTDDFAFLLGALVAEGTFMSDKIEFTNVPGDFADAFQQTWKNVFPTCRLHTFMRQPVSYGKRPFWQMQIVSHQMRAFFGNLGLKGRSAERQIPDAILRSPQPVAAAFLRGLFEGDGAVERSGRSLLRVSLCSRNEAFMKQVQTLLLRFGIVCARSREEQRRMHRLCITGRDNLQRFADRIGFVSQNKQQALSEVLQIHSGRSLTKTDFVPFLADYVRGKATRHREWLDRHNFDRSARLPEALPRLAQALPPADVEQIEFLARTHYLFDEVVSVEDAGEQRVYSVRVDSECHSFVANGFVNHNTEARLTALATEMMEDIDRDTVDWMPTYDQSDNEPLVLPGRFPNFLCNGGEGIAVGMTTKVPPHNLREVCDACIWMLEKPDATVAELMKFIQGPDFPTAGIILGTKGIKEAYETGRGRVIVQANMQIEPMEGGKNAIVITELPYQVNKQRLIENIAELHKQKKVDGITSILDLTDRHGMRVVIELRRDAYPRKVLNFLLKHTALRTTFGVIMLALVDQQPRLLTLPAAIGHYLKHRREMIVRRTRYELGRAKQRAHILEGLQIALDVMDEIIRIIRAAEDDSIARTEMMARFGFTQIQAEAILSMQLRQLTRLNRNRLEEEYKGKLKEVAGYEDILVNPARVTAIVKGELKTLKDKYGDERRTRIIPTEAEEIGEEDLIPEEDMLVTITRDGYVKRVPMDTYRTQKRGGRGIIGANTKEEDTIEHLFVANTHDYILFFTNRGRVYKLKAYEVPQTSRQAMGTAVVNLINIEPGDVVTATVPVKDLHSAEGFMFFTTQNGEVKRVDLKDFANLRANGLICFDLEPDDELKWVKLTDGNQECILITHGGKSIRFKEGDVPSRGRPAGGVRGIEMRDSDGKLKDRVVAMDVVRPTSQLLVVGERGIGKRTNLADYRAQTRGGKGIITMDITEKTGNIVDAVVVEPDDKLMIITKNGITIRMEVAGIRAAGRSTQGVKLINLEPGDSVATIERLARSEDVEETGKVTHAAPDATGKV